MLKIIDYILSGIVMSSSVLYMLSKLSGNKINFKSWKTYFVFVLLGLVQFLNYYFTNGYVKIFLITIFVIFLYYYYFKKNKKEAVVTTILVQLIIMTSEFIFSGIMIFLFGTNFSKIMNSYANSGMFIFNFLISVISFALVHVKIIHKFYCYLLSLADHMSEKIIIVLMVFMMITINIIYASTFYKINTVYLLLIDIALLFIYLYIVINILNEKDRYIRISSKYNVTISSLHELRDVVSILKIKGHENRNQLKTIRDMIKKKDKKVIKYIDTLLGEKLKEDEKLRIETSIITNSEISSLIYSKMITMKDKGINVLFHVDKALEKFNLYDMDDIMTLYICKIIGVWLDNAIEAVNNLKTKNIEMHMYVDLDNNINITISNNYDGQIDLKSINKDGYTTKGIEHGFGLSLVRDIVDNNKKFDINTTIQNNIFTQSLKIKM